MWGLVHPSTEVPVQAHGQEWVLHAHPWPSGCEA